MQDEGGVSARRECAACQGEGVRGRGLCRECCGDGVVESDAGEGEIAQLVRLDLADSAKSLGMRCVHRVLVALRAGDVGELWVEVAADFGRAERGEDNRRLARACSTAAQRMARGDTNGAVEALATYCGLNAEGWIVATREEQGGR